MMRKTQFVSWLVVSLLAFGVLLQNSTSTQAATAVTTTITVNGTGSGKTFDGIGAISGGGATSRLLIDYPAQQQKEILDYLFKPGYGDNLQILKVEIGGDTDTTNGAEASHMRTRTDQNYNRGYEWWLMEQAKARNPNIKLYGLEWGAPGWIGNGNFWSQDNITYILNWLQHAQSDHGLHIDYIGGWNERGYNATWFENLKSALKSNNLATQIVAADSNWNVATAMQGDATFNNAVDIVGEHYPCGWRSAGTSCPSTTNAQSLNKPLWASENGSEQYDAGAVPLARVLNRDYIDGKMTATINWSLAAAWYSTLPYAGDGLLQADQPWSGYYHVGKSAWVTAHTTQFAQPGWHYIDSATGYLGGNSSNGSYVTLKSTNNKDHSTIIETGGASAAQTATFQVSGGLSTGSVHVWATNLNSANSSDYFVHTQDITPNNGSFSLTLQPNYVYTLTTTTGQGKGVTTPPASTIQSLPFSDNFEGYKPGQLTHYFSDISGAYESATCGGGRSGICLRQVISAAPIAWQTNPAPLTLVGDPRWTSYQVSTDALLEQAGYVQLIGNVTGQNQNNAAVAGYHLRISNTGAWTLYKENLTFTDTTLASGTASFGINQWHRLSLKMSGGSVQAVLDGTSLTTISDNTYPGGQIGLQTSAWQNAQFDNFSVVSVGSGGTTFDPNANYKLLNRNSGLAMDVTGRSTTAGAVVEQWTDNGGTNQQWHIVAVGGGYYKLVNTNSALVLDVVGQSTSSGAAIDQWTDTGGTNQQWNITASGNYYTLTSKNSGLVLDVPNKSTTNGTALDQATSNSAANQQWSIVKV